MNYAKRYHWQEKLIRFLDYLNSCRLLIFAFFLLYLLGQVFYRLFTSSWDEIFGVLMFGALAVGVLTVLTRIIPRLEHSKWHIITLMFVLLVATVILVIPAVELWHHA